MVKKRVDVELSSDLEQAPSLPRAPSPKVSRGKKTNVSRSTKGAPGVDKDAQRRHKALECQFHKVQCQAQSSACPSTSDATVAHQSAITALPPQEVDQSDWSQNDLVSEPQVHTLACLHRDLDPQRPGSSGATFLSSQVPQPIPEATFTPTAADLHAGEGHSCGQALDF